MVVKKVAKKRAAKNAAKSKPLAAKKPAAESNEGVSLDDAFGDDEDVEYAPSKPKKEKKKGMSEEELEEELEVIEAEQKVAPAVPSAPVTISASKPISGLKKGDRIQIDGKEYIVDAHAILIDHGNTKEMALELYDSTDRDYQLRYFSDQVENTLEFYELQEILYVKKPMVKIVW